VCVNVDRRSRFLPAVTASRTWAVSVLTEQGQHAATWFAHRDRPVAGQFDHVPHARGPFTGAALVRAAVAWLECRTWAEHDGGDHVMLVGEVVGARVQADPVDSRGAVHPDRPLLYYRSHYGALLRSGASEHDDVALRAAILHDDAGEDPTAQVPDRSGHQ
jgi:flavin reductase (DIM6/NTAB) family NADH-FMN oxidoreductase RutF